MTIDTRLAEIRARVENATEGPWSVYRGDRIGTYITRPDLAGVAREWSLTWSDADAEFIAASRTDLPALLAAVEAVRKRADRWAALDRPEGDDFHAGFNAGVKFAAGQILRDITAELDAETTTRKDQTHD